MNIRTSQREQVLARACGHVSSLPLTIVPSHFSLSVVKQSQRPAAGFSVTVKAAWRDDRLKLGQIEIADRLQRVGQRAVSQVGR